MTKTLRIVARPGYLGGKRDQIQAEWDTEYGTGNWWLKWQWGAEVLDLPGALMLYEDAYHQFLWQNPDVIAQLVAEASDVYDDAPSNVASGLDYTRQETNRNHFQDIAIRRCLVRLGRRFEGSQPIQIRDHLSEHQLGMTLSPGQVPFHQPELVVLPEQIGWWLPGSVESFYQSNKVLVVAG